MKKFWLVLVAVLIAGCATPVSKNTKDMITAIKSNDKELLKMLVSDPGATADINGRDESGRVPLAYAAIAGHGDLARMLIDHGADVAARDNDGMAPIHLAASTDHKEIVAMLLDKGVDVNVTDGKGRTPLHFAARFTRDRRLLILLLDHGADVEAKDVHGTTPLGFAFASGNTEMVETLMRYEGKRQAQ